MRAYIHTLFQEKQYIQLYKEYTAVLNDMLLLETFSDFEDFLSQSNILDEDIFWLYYTVHQGGSLLIEGYEEDVTETIKAFLKQKLPESIFLLICDDLKNIYLDLGTKDTLIENINICNNHLNMTKYFIQVEYDETYSAGVYFLSVTCS